MTDNIFFGINMITPYLYAMGAILCWASLPAATGSGLNWKRGNKKPSYWLCQDGGFFWL